MTTKVLVIGGGPGGHIAAVRAAQLGADITSQVRMYLISRPRLGRAPALIRCKRVVWVTGNLLEGFQPTIVPSADDR